MASPGNQQCASCIGTLSFPMFRRASYESGRHCVFDWFVRVCVRSTRSSSVPK